MSNIPPFQSRAELCSGQIPYLLIVSMHFHLVSKFEIDIDNRCRIRSCNSKKGAILINIQ